MSDFDNVMDILGALDRRQDYRYRYYDDPSTMAARGIPRSDPSTMAAIFDPSTMAARGILRSDPSTMANRYDPSTMAASAARDSRAAKLIGVMLQKLQADASYLLAQGKMSSDAATMLMQGIKAVADTVAQL